MTRYREMAKAARRSMAKLTFKQQIEVLKIYEDVIWSLSKKARNTREDTLTRRWLEDYREEIIKERLRLQRDIEKTVTGGMEQAAKIGTEFQISFWDEVEKYGIATTQTFKTMLSRVPLDAIQPILTGDLYVDDKSLSGRIWGYGNDFSSEIQYIINKGIIEKKSAVELAEDLEQYVKPRASRPTDWGNVYPNLKYKEVDYNAMRLARTSIMHAYQTSTLKGSDLNPFVEGIEWHSALDHRTCEICRERHGQIFDKDDVPLDHPNGACTLIPYIQKDTQEVATEIREWLEGGTNPTLDEWYIRYGDLFADKTI